MLRLVLQLLLCCLLNIFTFTCILMPSLPRDATQSAVMLQYVICLSVRLSMTFRYHDHIGWNSSRIISRPNSLKLMRGLTPTWAICCNGNTPKIRVEYQWGHSGAQKKPATSPKRCKIGSRLLWETNRKSHTRFRLAPKSITLNGVSRECPKFLSTRYYLRKG